MNHYHSCKWQQRVEKHCGHCASADNTNADEINSFFSLLFILFQISHFLSLFIVTGPASIGLLSPGTLEYLLESLVSQQQKQSVFFHPRLMFCGRTVPQRDSAEGQPVVSFHGISFSVDFSVDEKHAAVSS